MNSKEVRRASPRVVLAFLAITGVGAAATYLTDQGSRNNSEVRSSQVDPKSLALEHPNRLLSALTKLIPTATPTVIPSRIAAQQSFPTVESGAVRSEGVKVYDNNRFQQENINPHDPAAFMNFQTSCQESPTRVVRRAQTVGGLASLVLSKVRDLFVSTAEAETLETPEEFIKCIQDVEAQRPFLTSEAAASEHNFKKINVGNLKPQDVIGIDTVANWQQKLASELQKRGFDISQKDVDDFIASLQFTFRDPKTGKVGVFRPVFFQTQKEVDEKRNGGDLTARFIGEEVAVVVDPATGQMIWVEKNKSNVCDNESVPGSLKKIEATPTATTPAASPSGESPSSTPTAVRPAPSETPTPSPVPPTAAPTNIAPVNTETPGPTATAVATRTPGAATPTAIAATTPTAAPTNIAPVPTETAGPTATAVATRTPGAATPTAIAAATSTAISAATPTAIGGAPSAPTAVKPGG